MVSRYLGTKLFILIFFVCPSSWTAAAGAYMGLPEVLEGVDTPTAYTLSRGSYRGNLRFYSGGGIHLRMGLGFYDRFYLGVGMTTNNLIGEGRVVADPPRVGLKLRFLDEKGWMPSMALGWDNRGYGHLVNDEYYPRGERGIYLVASRQAAKFLLLHAGVSAIKPKDLKTIAKTPIFVGLTLIPHSMLELRLEWDDLSDKGGGNLNAAIRAVLEEGASIGIDFNSLGGGLADPRGHASLSQPRLSGRMLTLEYKSFF